MTIGLVGRKVGMTRIFTEDGVSTPVTVLEVEANRIAQVKTVDNDGYSALQVTTGSKKANRVTKSQQLVILLKLVSKQVVACGNSA